MKTRCHFGRWERILCLAAGKVIIYTGLAQPKKSGIKPAVRKNRLEKARILEGMQ